MSLSLLAIASAASANASITAESIDINATYSAADEQGRYVYLIRFAEPGLIEQNSRRSSQPFNYQTPANLAARDTLMAIQAEHVRSIQQTLGRAFTPSHHYLASQNGIAARLTAAEAQSVLALPEVLDLQRERVYELNTYRGPEFIGAPAIWGGAGVPNGTPYLGEGMVAAILDSGIPDPTVHPSFINDASCGHGVGGNPDKVLSFLDCSSSDGSGLCNGPAPIGTDGHGSHTASTVAGNAIDNSASPSPGIPAIFSEMSGVAPCANMRSYRVCPGSSCPGADIAAGLESVLIHDDASVMNYSISGGASPWNDFDRTKLDLVEAGIFVAASAGNTRAATPDPVGAVNHRGPWVMSVAASTHDTIVGKSVSLAGGPTGVPGLEGTGPDMAADFVGELRYAGDVDAANFEGCAPFAAAAFDGEAALISRGSCSFANKVDNAVAAGATFVVVFNNAPGLPIVMGGLEATTVSSVMVSNSNGTAMVAALGGATAEVTVTVAEEAFIEAAAGDTLAGFSLRGPTAAPLQDLQKPNITAPGVNIYAAVPGGYAFLSGTSMSGPHVAGAGLLVRQANPTWTVSEVKSAMQMTAFKDGTKENGTTPWDWDDVGHGRVDLTKAALAGLVMDESIANYLAADPGTGGDVKTLNLPDVRNLSCTPTCTFERTLRNTLGVASNWAVTTDSGNANLDLQVSPTTFSFTGGTSETVTLTITAAPQANLTAAIEFGQIVLTENAAQAPEAHLTTAISGTSVSDQQIAVTPTEISELLGAGSSTSVDVEIANLGDLDLNWSMEFFSTTANRGVLDVIWDQPADGTGGIISDEFLGSPAGDVVVLSANDFDINAAQEIAEIFVPGFWNGGNVNTAVALNWQIYADANGVPAGGPTGGAAPVWSYSAAPGTTGVAIADNNITLDVEAATASAINLPSGRYWLVFYPTINFGPDFNARWNWSQGIAALGTSHLIDPANLFDAGATDWTPQTALGVPWSDTAFTLSGRTNCQAAPPAWLSVNATSGTVSGNNSQTVSVTLDASALAVGTYDASLCITSDDPVNPLVFTTVELQVVDPADLPQIEVAPASLAIGVDLFNPTGSDSIDVSNLGNSIALDWQILTSELAGGTRGGSIVEFNNIDYVVPTDFDGGSITWQTGVAADGFDTSANFNPYNSPLTFFWPSAPGTRGGVSLDGTAYAVLEPGDTVGATSQFLTSGSAAAMINLQAGATGYLGFQFDNTDTSTVNYGYALVESVGPDGTPLTIRSWAFDSSGADITIPMSTMPQNCDDPTGVPWINLPVNMGSTAAGATDNVAVEVDATGFDPGVYEAVLCVFSNDPATSLVEVPVSMTVGVPANASLVEGTVQGLGYCQADPILAGGAGVQIIGQIDTFNLTADANGFYSVYIDELNGPIDVTASAPSHITGSQTGVAIAGGTTTVVDFGLVLEVPCAQVAPASFSEVFAPGDTGGNYSLSIVNALGGDQLVWGIQEATPTVGYGYGLEGAGELVNNTDGARGSETLANERAATQSPFVDAGVQGAPIAANFTETFDDITVLPGAGWSLQNLSDPLGTTDWFQGNPATFPAHEGDPTAYIGANFNNTSGGTGIISNWLMTPEVELRNGTELRFWTRVPSNDFPDRLEVRLSTSGSSTFAGSAATDVGDFDTLVLSIDENLVGDYPVVWTEFVVEVSGLAETTSGRFAFRYFVTDAGPSGANSNYIGIDTVSVGQPNFCQNPADVPWLSVSPFFGATDAGESSAVDVGIDTSGLDSGSYQAFICVNSNDPEADLIQVPFSIEVLGDGVFQDRFEG